jgi:hypothetical protein
MKKFIQISLVIILVFGLFQFIAAPSMDVAAQPSSMGVRNISSITHAPVQDIQMAACLVRIKGVACVKPLVGWNS